MFLDKLFRRRRRRQPAAPRASEPRAPVKPDQDLVLYKFDSCPYCRRVMRVIDDLGLEIELRDTREERRWREDLVQRTGRTQVPCLFIDGEPLFESADINDWLRARYG